MALIHWNKSKQLKVFLWTVEVFPCICIRYSENHSVLIGTGDRTGQESIGTNKKCKPSRSEFSGPEQCKIDGIFRNYRKCMCKEPGFSDFKQCKTAGIFRHHRNCICKRPGFSGSKECKWSEFFRPIGFFRKLGGKYPVLLDEKFSVPWTVWSCGIRWYERKTTSYLVTV